MAKEDLIQNPATLDSQRVRVHACSQAGDPSELSPGFSLPKGVYFATNAFPMLGKRLSKSDATKPDAQRVYEVLLKMLDRWNAHDFEGHLEAYWKSPELLVIVDSEQFNGWQQL